jgi:prolyl oligopeptidase
MTAIDPRPNLAAPDDDPWLWLEEIEGERALAYVDEETRGTRAAYGGPGFERDRDMLAALLNRQDRIPYITKRGEFVYNLWQDEVHPRGLWRRTTLNSYRTPAPDWDVLLDLDALARTEGEDWVWQGAGVLPVSHDRAALRLSRGGSDAVVLREFDIGTRAFVADGFVLPEAKGDLVWLDRDTVLLSSAFGDGMATTSGYARTIRLWRRGADPASAPVVFEVPATALAASGDIDRTSGAGQIWFIELSDFFNSVLWLGDREGARTRVEVPSDSTSNCQRDWLTIKLRTPWSVGGVTHPADRLLGISLAAFLAGDRNFRVLFEPGERRILQHSVWAGEHLLLAIFDNLLPRFETYTPGENWRHRRLDSLAPHGVVTAWPLEAEDSERTGILLVQQEDPVTPPRLLSLDLRETLGAPALLRAGPALFDPSGLVVSQHEAVSSDGERIPYTQVGPRDGDGDAPVHLSGYGGFGVSEKPYYRAGIGKLWLERGGTSVVANLRGGGEFGARWHEAGRRAGKRLAHDDFAAVAADLVRRGVTRAGRIAAEGGSNGGLLIANMLTRFPERFGALFCTIPLIDMRRYAKLLAGASWIAEYGDPDNPDDWAFLGPISAYHAVEAGKAYPPILLATTRRDDRVHPGHARKMAAKLQALGYPAHLFEPAAGGHGYGKDNAERAAFVALGYAFLARHIGWDVEAQ